MIEHIEYSSCLVMISALAVVSIGTTIFPVTAIEKYRTIHSYVFSAKIAIGTPDILSISLV